MKIIGWILKGIGKLLLGILLLLLLLIVLVLFVPLRYRLAGDKQGDHIEANGTVSWLFHFVHAGVRFADQKLNICLRIIGIPLFKKEIAFGESDSESDEEEEEETSAALEEETESLSDIPFPRAKKVQTAETPVLQKEDSCTSEPHIASRSDTAPQTTKDTTQETKSAPPEAETSAQSEPEPEKKSFEERIQALTEKFKQTYESLHDRYESVSKKLEKGKKLLFHERTQAAIQLVKRNVWRILRHIAPRRMQGQIRIGLPDSPGLMGQILVFASMLYPLYGECVEFQPEYEEKVLDGSLKLSGRIMLGWLLFNALQVLFSRNVRFVRAVLKKWKQEA